MSKQMTKERIAEILKQKADWRWSVSQVVGECLDEIESLQAVVKQLPKCWRLVDGKRVQDVPVVPGGKVYGYAYGDRHIEAWRVRHISLTGSVYAELWEDPPIVITRLASEFSSTEAAARAAGESEENDHGR